MIKVLSICCRSTRRGQHFSNRATGPGPGASSAGERRNKAGGAGSSFTGPKSDSVDLSTGFVDLMSAKNGFAVNISVMKIADEMQKYVIDIMA
jgi:hypothetical protein